jgi:hypothetical protein
VAGLTAGRDAIFFVAVFTEFVSGILELGSLGTVVAAAASASIDAGVVTLGAVVNFGLVGSVREGYIAHFGRQGDFCGTVVGGNQGGGTEGDETDSNHDSKNFFHFDTPLQCRGMNVRQDYPAQFTVSIYIGDERK